MSTNKKQQQPTKPKTGDAEVIGFRQTGMHDSSYHVRGGGFTPNQSLSARIASITIIVFGISLVVIASLYLKSCMSSFDSAQVVTITTEQSHEAYLTVPKLLDCLYGNASEIYDGFAEAGMSVFRNDRTSTDNPDNKTNTLEIVYFPAGATENDFASYTASEFSSYDFDELQGRLLGSWMIELSDGELGRFAQLKYTNLATEGIFDEMHWALNQQGLTAEGSTLVFEGEDRFGNSVIYGYIVLENESVVYWQTISCPFEARYHGSDVRQLPNTAVYIKIRIATWDFYGVDSFIDPDASSD